MENLKRIHATEDLLGAALSEIGRLKQALRDIAQAEAIPNESEAFYWCVNVAQAALDDSDAEADAAENESIARMEDDAAPSNPG